MNTESAAWFRELDELSWPVSHAAVEPTGSKCAPAARRGAVARIEWTPRFDISESAEEFHVRAELPEVRKECLRVSIDAGLLRIWGERSTVRRHGSRTYHRLEHEYGFFLRVFALPDNVDAASVDAAFEASVLDVRLPKAEMPRSQARDVDIR